MAPVNAKAVLKATEYGKTREASRAKRPAPEFIPIIPGLAKVLLRLVWRIKPETDRAAPQKAAAKARGRRILSSMIFTPAGISLPEKRPVRAARPSLNLRPLVPARMEMAKRRKKRNTPVIYRNSRLGFKLVNQISQILVGLSPLCVWFCVEQFLWQHEYPAGLCSC